MSATGRATLAACVAVLTAGCESVPLLAPDSTILLQANPSFVVAHGGRSVVTAVLTEPAGTFVPDGTVVFFFTDLGQIDARAKTVDGIARVYFVADSRSGQACVTAYSGGVAPEGACGDSGGTASGQGNASVAIDIGSALPRQVIMTAVPPRIMSPGRSTIVASVFDGSGNPVQNVPVVFRIADISPLEETLDSGGSPRYTNSNGEAFDTLRTRRDPAGSQKKVTVNGSIPGVDNVEVEPAVVYVN